jgi:glycosyltransferase involved in cell wall biosynthesis
MRSPEKLAENIWFHSLHVPKLGWLRSGYQGCIRAVRKALRRIRPDLVHAHGTERDCGLCGIFSGLPNVLTIHGNMRLIAKLNNARVGSYQWLAAQLEKVTLPRAGGVICLSGYTRDAVDDLAQRTWVVPNAVDSTFFEVVPVSGVIQLILCIANICERKNQQQFIRALDPLAAECSLQVLFLGSASAQDPYCAEFFKMIETRPWCSYGGMAARGQLKDYLSRALLLALPSLEDNCPMAVLEAMAASVPVLVAKVGGLPDLVENEINGLFCDPSDLSNIRAGVQRLLDNRTFRQELAAAAKRKALSRFHPVVIARRHLEIYREVLSTNS